MARPAEQMSAARTASAPRFDWSDPAAARDRAHRGKSAWFRDTARDYAQSALMPRILEAHRTERFEPAIMRREMGERGLLGATIGRVWLRGAWDT